MNEGSIAVTESITVTNSIYLFVKRAFDLIISVILLVVLSPLFLLIILAIKIDSKGKAIYTQTRIGQNGKTFKLYKFRSMVSNADKVLFELLEKNPELKMEYDIHKKLKNDPRVTRVGKIIRKLSMDELPQLINVINGDMSLIGNRPYLEREIKDMGRYYEDIIKTKPGITGYWQVNGRSKTTFKSRCKMEADYSKRASLKLDMQIFLKTFKVLVKGL